MAGGYAPFSERLPKADFAQWGMSGDGYQMSLMKARYRHGGEAVWRRAAGVLQYVLEGDTGLAMSRGPGAEGFKSVPPLSFVGPDTTLQVRWNPGQLHWLLCEIDLDRLMRRATGLDGVGAEAVCGRADVCLESSFITLMMRRLAEEAVSPTFGTELRVDAIMLAIGIELRRLLDGADQHIAPHADGLSVGQVRAVQALAERGEDFSLDALGARFGVSGRRLSALYRRTTGATLRSYIAEARVRRAEALLLDARMMIKQVAHRSGFASTAALDAAFRRVTGMTPHEFRETTCGRLL